MKERLTERLDDGSVEYENREYIIRLYPQNEDCYNTEQKAILRLAEYEDVEEQGLLVRLPCIRKCEACFQVIYEDEYTKQITYITYGLGKITEAEKKLKELKEKKNDNA